MPTAPARPGEGGPILRIVVDEAVCSLNAECTLAAPDIFRIEDGELVWQAEIPPEHEAAVRAAVDACPSLAIEIVDE
jgi:ferredoxin